MLVAAVLLVYIIFIIFILALCNAAGEADRWEEKWIEQKIKEASENQKWCDDDCLHCEESDWCMFCEVKREG